MTVNEAIDIAWGIDKFCGQFRPSPQEALERIEQQLALCDFNWITGQEARQALQEVRTQSHTPSHVTIRSNSMNASKENAAKALAELDKEQPNRDFVREFLEAAERKLPKEASYERERSRK